MSAVLECVELTGGYGGVPAVRGLSLAVEPGEVAVLLGPNGAGKTTTLLTLAGVLTAISGEARVAGERVRGGRANRIARRGAMLVPDDRGVLHGLTTRENIELGLPRRDVRDGIRRVLDYFPALESRMAVRAGLLSGGEQQMLAIGRALARRPTALMVDELSLGLAPVIVKSILPTVRRIASDLGTAVLLVEQHVDLALAVATRAYVLNHGDLVLEGAASDLLDDRELLRSSYMGEATLAHAVAAERTDGTSHHE